MKNNWNCRGVTLIELLTAITVSSVTILLIFLFWQNFDKSIIISKKNLSQRRENWFFKEGIRKKLRKSSSLIEWTDNSIRYLLEENSDTVEIKYWDGILYLNDTLYPTNLEITEFLVSSSFIDENYNYSLINIYYKVKDVKSMEVTDFFKVTINMPEGDFVNDNDQNENRWNF